MHYIGYDGTIEDLMRKVSYYQQPENQQKLAQIAEEGCKFVRKNFRGPLIAKKLFDYMISVSDKIYNK